MSQLFWYEAQHENAALLRSSHCEWHQCYVVRGKTQEVNTSSNQH